MMRVRPAVALVALVLSAQAPAPSASQPAAPQPSAPDSWVPRGTAELIMLDKLRGQPASLTVPTGQSAGFGPLTITVRSCVARPADLPQNSAAFIEVVNGQSKATLFRGWMVANTPAVAQMEDPVFDMRLVSCR